MNVNLSNQTIDFMLINKLTMKSFMLCLLVLVGLTAVAQKPRSMKKEDVILYIKQSEVYRKAEYIKEELHRTHQEANDYFLNESMNENDNAIKLNRYNSNYTDLKDTYNKFIDLWAFNLSQKWKYDLNAEEAMKSSLRELENKLNNYKENFSSVSNTVAFGGVSEILAISGMVVELIKFIDQKAKDKKAKLGEYYKQHITEPLRVNEPMISVK